MTALLTDNLPLLADAPNGIKKLRELILELAVRGKLVPQEPGDEPASELLKRIAEEKARLVTDGKIKALKLSEELPNVSGLAKLPSSWRWVRFGEIAQHNSGKTLDKGRNTGISRDYITTSNLYWGSFELDNVKQMLIREDELDKCTATKNDLLICEGGEAGRAAVWEQDKEICFQNHVHRARLYGDISPHYAQRFFEKINATGEINQYRKGIGISNMSSKALASITFPVPPLAEQHRIVAKVDELMALCDRLEAQQADAESAHAQMVQAMLDSLTQASDAADFAANWRRLAEHFHTLFTTEPSIDALKQTLLQLAVMGKLVPQDPSDQPASELLNRISEEKKKLLIEGKLKKEKQLLPLDDAPFELPMNWSWSQLGRLIADLRYGTATKCDYSGTGIPVLRIPNIGDPSILLDDLKYGDLSSDEMDALKLLPDDLLMIRSNGSASLVGKTAVVTESVTHCAFAGYLIRLRLLRSCINSYYLQLAMKSLDVRHSIESPIRTTSGVKNINSTEVSNIRIPLPPLAEQHRIVAKVDQFMALCDQLKIRLTQARKLNEQLASTLGERALADDSPPASVTTDQKVARTLLAAEITHQLHGQRTFGQRKLQKVIYLAEHAAKLTAVQGNYLRDAAGPHDRQLMNQVENELCSRQWYECIDRENFGHAYRPLSQAGQHRQAFDSAWSTVERATIERIINLMRDWDTDRCEMTVTLYAAWNDFILEGRPVSDEAIVDEVMHSWNDAKLRFDKGEWLALLAEMKKHELLIPTGFGQRTTGGMLTLPGLE